MDNLSKDGSPVNALKEIIFLVNHKPVDFRLFIEEILPDIPLKIIDFFEDDFTAFLYYDDKGVWPGYVARLKPSVIVINAQTQTKQIESSDNLRNFFIQSVGSADVQGFQSGQSNGKPIRYLIFPKAAASLSYGWFTSFTDSIPSHYLFISASERGLEEAVKRLIK